MKVRSLSNCCFLNDFLNKRKQIYECSLLMNHDQDNQELIN